MAGVMDSMERLETAVGKPEKVAVAESKQKLQHGSGSTPVMKVCPSCRAENPANHQFCGKCGKGLAS